MRANISIEIEDDTSAEELRAAGITDQQAFALYERAFGQLLKAVTKDNGARYKLRINFVDNTKEEAKT